MVPWMVPWMVPRKTTGAWVCDLTTGALLALAATVSVPHRSRPDSARYSITPDRSRKAHRTTCCMHALTAAAVPPHGITARHSRAHRTQTRAAAAVPRVIHSAMCCVLRCDQASAQHTACTAPPPHPSYQAAPAAHGHD